MHVELLSPQERLKADAWLMAITVLWGATFVIVADALSHADVFTFLALRFFTGALVLTVWLRTRVFDARALRYGGIQSLFLFFGFALQTEGLKHTTPSRSAFITGLSVALVPLLSTLLFRKRTGRWTLLGIALAIAGLYWMTRASANEMASGTLWGDVLTLGAAVAYGFHITLNESFSRKAPVFSLVAVQLWCVAFLSGAASLFANRHWDPTPELWGAVILTGAFASALAISVQTWAQAKTSAVRAGLIFSLEPVYATAFSIGMGREALSSAGIIGGGLIVLGVLVSEVGGAVWSARRSSRA